MKVGDWMVRDVVSVSQDHTIQECVDLMKRHSIRHLPVVEGGRLVGLVTEGDLRQVFLASLIEELRIRDVMINDPVTVSPDTEIEDAAKIIFFNKIGGLPVVDDQDRLLGIITVADILAAFIELMGVLKSSSRIDVVLGDDPEAFERVSGLIRSRGGEIMSVGISGHRLRRKRVYYFRLKKCNVRHIARTLEKAGYEVISSVA
ncbi:MAG: CBS and ACT domain-containing protein [Thermodesulfobacteriota bacterium]